MFRRFRIKSFKTWGEQLWEEGVELAPITVLLGPNSAGKTSLLQLPLLLKQTFESGDRQLDLNLGGQPTDLVDLGGYQDVVHGHDTKAGLGLAFEWRAASARARQVARLDRVDFEVTYRFSAGAPAVDSLRYADGPDEYRAQRQSRGGYLLSAPGYEAPLIGNRPDARRAFRPERSVALPAEAIAELGAAGARVQDLSLAATRAVGAISYLGPLRERPARSYQWTGVTPGILGTRGEDAVPALLASANSRKKRKPDEEGGRGWLVDEVSRWLRRMGVADGLELERHGRSRHFEVMVTTGGARANVLDVGFGISQVLPMLVLAHFVRRGTTILAEQPEIHLHPRAQVGLAELFATVSRQREVQFILETHSEHLFRRLQVLVALGTLAPDDCRLYFIERQGGYASLRRLEMDPFGRIANWPEHFFGDAVGETERQMRAMLQRLRDGAPAGGAGGGAGG